MTDKENKKKSSGLKLVYSSDDDVKNIHDKLKEEAQTEESETIQDSAEAIKADMDKYFSKLSDSTDLHMESMVVISVLSKKESGEKLINYLGFNIDEDELQNLLNRVNFLINYNKFISP